MMKPSFYFVLWIVIYPILGLFNIPIINENAFIVAILIVFGLSWALHKMMPDILIYETDSEFLPIYEDAYTGNVRNFYSRLNRHTMVKAVTAIYFCVALAAMAFAAFSGAGADWVIVFIFALFTFGAVTRSVQLFKARRSLQENPTKEECEEIAENTYKPGYDTFAQIRKETIFEQMLPPRPKHFTTFLIVSLLFAAAAVILGLFYLIKGISIFFSSNTVQAWAFGSMGFLYGTLATYFGIKDFLTTLTRLRRNKI